MSLISADDICALATPYGGAIGIIRTSGPHSIALTDRIFKAVSGKKMSEANSHTLHFGEIHNQNGEVIDEVLVSVFKSPHSYTGEDSTEISCHGSQYILTAVLQELIHAGFRQARPGEYTQRAYLNGKMDLSQAEAVADLIASKNKATHQLAMKQLKGHFSLELSRLREQLLKLTSLLELELDFSDHEELQFADRGELLQLSHDIETHIGRLVESFKTGTALKEGIPVTIIGKTNVGKSTLLNLLLHEDKAIVSDISGTTRDIIEDTTVIGGITFRLIDTAGIRETTDKIEQIGIQRAYQKLKEATIVLWMIDQQPSYEEIREMQKLMRGKSLIIIQNKIDITSPINEKSCLAEFSSLPFVGYISMSAKTQYGLSQLEKILLRAANLPHLDDSSVIVTNIRHYNALTHARTCIQRVINGIKQQISGDILAEDLKLCINDLAEITGTAITPTEVLSNIFQHFCIGK